MIIEYDSSGRIFHLINDPVDPAVVKFYLEKNSNTLNLEPTPWPLTPDIDVETGEPLMELIDDDEVQVLSSKGLDYVHVDPINEYVKDGAIIPRPSFDLPDLVTSHVGLSHVFSKLPVGSVVAIDDVFHELEDNELLLEFEMAETYKLQFSCWPYLDKVVEVNIHEA